MTLKRSFFYFLLFFAISIPTVAQISIGEDLPDVEYGAPKSYIIGGITVTGVQYLDNSVLVTLSGLRVGDKVEIPGEKIHTAIVKLWEQGLFDDVKIKLSRIQDNQAFLDIILVERPRLSKFSFSGIRKGEADDLREKIKLVAGDVVTENLLVRSTNIIKKHYIGKGFFDVEVDIKQLKDTARANYTILKFDISKNGRVRIASINIEGNEKMPIPSLKSSMKKTKERGAYKILTLIQEVLFGGVEYAFTGRAKEYPDFVKTTVDNNFRFRIFKSSKFIQEDYDEDKLNLIRKFNDNGYRDAQLLKDSIYKVGNGLINIDLSVVEGRKYYHRDISFVGNTKYTADELALLLGIRKGDIFRQDQLEAALQFNPNGVDLMSLFVDDGYLTCQIEPIELNVENDSIDIQIRIREGKQMTINQVIVKGNTRTNDHVIIRELYSVPGRLFSRSDILRSRTSLAQMKYFDPEKIDIQTPNINPADGTVDVLYGVEETSSDQLELSGGWGYGRLIGTLGVSFNNFSARNFFNKGAWQPVPSGDGQKLSLRMQSYGKGYLSFSTSFTEPWLGGKRPQQLSVSAYVSAFNNGLATSSASYYSYNITGMSVVFSRRLNWPDNYFNLSNSISYQRYKLKNYTSLGTTIDGNGNYHNLSYTVSLGRYSTDATIYARSGSEVNFSLEFTPPYSLVAKEKYRTMDEKDKYRLVEFHQWKFMGTFYKQIVGDLVLMARTKSGFLGKYNNDLEVTPFNRYFMGGDGMTGYSAIDGRQLVGFRGYANESMTPNSYLSQSTGGIIYNKNTLELRYPLSLNPNSTIYGMAFVEAGNAWLKFRDYSPFDLKRSAGVGVRVFLPMFGLLGLDWGYGFDAIPGVPTANKGQFHFSINSSID
ncbi:MAG: BamA/TamA family outer membrane protein [Bacteroidales bacterium]|nr:BamA/TamA family outer membrane protein [Bacteroidales bacterium]